MLTHLKKHDNLENALLWQDMPKTFCSGMSGKIYYNTRGDNVNGEKQNTSDTYRKKYANELPETKRSIGNAQLD